MQEYAKLADIYDRKWSRYVEATARETLTRLEIATGDRVLDIGCGTGTLLVAIARTCATAELWGIDLTREMLSVARERVPRNVHLCAGAADRLPWGNDSFDAVVSCSMFHYVSDPIASIAEANRVLRPGGRFVMTDWCRDFPSCRVILRCLRLANRPIVQTYGVDDIKAMLCEAGLADIAIDSYKISWLWGLMTARASKPAAGHVGITGQR